MNLKAKLLAVTLLAAFSISMFRVFPTELASLLLVLEIIGFTFSYFLGLYFFKNTPFKCVPYVILGAFFGIVIDIIAFPTVNGFERNLFPIEIAIHVLIAAILSFGLAFVSFLILKFKSKKA
jgi:hypothetical protein